MEKTLTQSFQVTYEYPVIFTEGIFESENNLLASLIHPVKEHIPPKVIFIIDSGVHQEHPELISKIECYSVYHTSRINMPINPIVIQGGEAIKNDIKYLMSILELIDEQRIDRHAYLIAIGGGALLDAVGFAATIAHRGIKHIRIPTTVLSQNDSGVGVKNSFNAFNKKNFIGTFSPPEAVINDTTFLRTLTDRDWLAGVSEAIKVALIKDANFFDFIEMHIKDIQFRNEEAMGKLIFRCAELHVNHIGNSGDPFERGSSRPLDFGHWAAHKLEQLTNYSLLHGEAVAVGIALDVTYAYLSGMLPVKSWHRVLNLIHSSGLKLYHPAMRHAINGRFEVLDGLEEFREHLGGVLTVMMLKDIGEGVEVHHIKESLMKKAIDLLASLSPADNRTSLARTTVGIEHGFTRTSNFPEDDHHG
ncbi:3-dehydroquinate synthase [Limibacter armeniacum]|uniref:3-dehydroquinate synthase n=1 Tax=Limibacter armeniacum TaxID=466084 RepID=UPI002FE6B2D8